MTTTDSDGRASVAGYAALAIAVAVLLGTGAAVGSFGGTGPSAATSAPAAETTPPGTLSGEVSLADAAATFRGGGEDDAFGAALANVGDVNGDGYADVAVGAPFDDTGAKYGGAVYIFFGPVDATELDAADADAVLYGPNPNARAGTSIAGVDANGDGTNDIVVGAPFDDTVGHDAGAAYVVYGGSDLGGETSLATADHVLHGEAANDLAGYDVAGVGDPDDGEPDRIVVGAPRHDAAAENAGAAYVLRAPPTGTISLANADAELTGESANAHAGWSVADAEDVDGDGSHDLVVGAPYKDATTTEPGTAYVVTDAGKTGTHSLATATVRLEGVASRDGAGFAVSGAGDVNDDGYADVVVGAPFNDSRGSQSGVAYVVLGGPDLGGTLSLAAADLTLYGADGGDRAGWAVSSAGSGDVTCDAYADVLVGAPGNDAAAENAGAAYLIVGGADPAGDRALEDAHAVLRGERAGDRAGSAVSDVGDVTDDDTKDVLVGAPGNDAAAENAGAAYLLDGDCEPPEETTTTTTQPTTTTERTTTTTTTERTTTTTEQTTTTTTEEPTTTTTEEPPTTTTEEPPTTTTEEPTTTTTEDPTTTTTEEPPTTTTEDPPTTTTEEPPTTTTEDPTTTTTERTTTTEPTEDRRAGISFVAFCVADGERAGNDQCPDGEGQLVKFEWNGNEFVPEGGDAEGVTVTVEATKDGEPVEVSWTSETEISTVVVKSSTDTCEYAGGTSGTAESCGPPNAGTATDLPAAETFVGWLVPVAAVLSAVGIVHRRRFA